MDKLKKVGKWLGIGLLGLLVVVGVIVAAATWSWSSRLDERYETAEHDFEIPALSDENRAEAERLYLGRGCGDCHGEDGAGRTIADVPPFALIPPNITGVMRELSASELHALVRRGVRPDGSPVFFMPSHEYQRMPDEELGLITAHVRSLPQSDASHPPSEMKALGRVLELLGALDTPFLPAEVIDLDGPFDPPGPDEFGSYLAQGCQGCHGATLSGGPIPGAPEEDVGVPPNLTPHATGLEGWTLEQFSLAITQGQTPDGPLNPDFMPYRTYSHMTEEEIAALFAHLQALEPLEFGNR